MRWRSLSGGTMSRLLRESTLSWSDLVIVKDLLKISGQVNT